MEYNFLHLFLNTDVYYLKINENVGDANDPLGVGQLKNKIKMKESWKMSKAFRCSPNYPLHI